MAYNLKKPLLPQMSQDVAARIELEMALENASIENGGTYGVEEDRITRHFSGDYTIAEVEAVLRDMRSVQTELDQVQR